MGRLSADLGAASQKYSMLAVMSLSNALIKQLRSKNGITSVGLVVFTVSLVYINTFLSPSIELKRCRLGGGGGDGGGVVVVVCCC